MIALRSSRLIVGCMVILSWVRPSLGAFIEPVPDAVQCPVIDKQKSVEPDHVRLYGFVGTRIDANVTKRLLIVNEDELLSGFRKRPGKQEWIGEHVGKWLHAATLAWVYAGDTGAPGLREKMDRVAAELLKCQEPDGYLGTYLEKDRWTSWDVWVHKYDLMGLLTYYRYTGNKPALDGAKHIGDLLCNTFGKDKRDIIKAGEHMGMAATSVLEPMVLLYRATGDKRYYEFCRYLVWAWDQPHGPKVLSTLSEGKGVNQVANGKAYEMLSNLVGLCELYRTTGEDRFLTPVVNAWQDIVAKRLYLTGSASQREVFGDDFALPNDMKPNVGETCVTVTWMQLNAQLLRLTDESRYADELEKSLYNHLLGAQKPSGEQWCYYTSLEGTKPYNGQTNCCLSSGPRGLALMPTFAYGTDWHGGVAVNFYEAGQASLTLQNGQKMLIQQETNFPGSGDVQITLHPGEPVKFPLMMRIPWWCPGSAVTVTINNVPNGVDYKSGYYGILLRKWREGDKIALHLPLGPHVVEGAHTNADKVALMYGPLVLAADEASNPQAKPFKQVSLFSDLQSLDMETPFTAETKPASNEYNVYQVHACISGSGKAAELRLVPFAESGKDGSYFQVWFPKAGAECAKKQ